MREIKIQVPEGYEGIDEQASNFAEGKIVFKKKKNVAWKKGHNRMDGYFIANSAEVMPLPPTYCAFSDNPNDNNVFATERQAKSALAMAQLSQIMQNDSRFGGPVTINEWKDGSIVKHVIECYNGEIGTDCYRGSYHFLAFHTRKQGDLFLEENRDLVEAYFMLD